MNILGISAYFHDSAAALVRNGEIVAAAQEERFSRRKHDPRFPVNAVRYCLDVAGGSIAGIDHVVFYEQPQAKFHRLLNSYLAYAPRGCESFLFSMPRWLLQKLRLKHVIGREVAAAAGCQPKDVPVVRFCSHHRSHAASAFLPGPFQRAAILCMDGVGEWATTSAWLGEGNTIRPLWQIDFPHSLGLLYSAFTDYTGFKVDSGEYKVMGLAPYGCPRYADLIREHLIDIKADGSFCLNMEYFNYAAGLSMTTPRFFELFGGPPRLPETRVTQKEMDLAASIQAVTDEVVLKLGRALHEDTGVADLCMAGGVALNCVANGRLLRDGPFRDIWIQPAAGDAGGAVGAALSLWHETLGNERRAEGDSMKGARLGPRWDNAEVRQVLDAAGASYEFVADDALFPLVGGLLARDKVVGWFQGPMEFGPRALGGRSILGDPRSPTMQSVMNLKIKYRESFRPFAPSVLRERVADYFELDCDSPYMLLVAEVRSEHRRPMTREAQQLFGIDKLNVVRSSIPAVTHVDYSARIQTVDERTSPRYYRLLKAFESITGCGVLINTSFNVRGEPIVCTPEDAYRCFMRTEMDILVIENLLLYKSRQADMNKDESWREEFELD